MSDNATPFTEMAARIEAAIKGEFAGALVLVPPAGEPIAFLTTSPKPNLVQFWGTVKNLIDVAAQEAVQAAMQQDPWARR